ncbi:MAG: threonine ammonia-lyase IlvA [Cytophagales bacterium]|nr:threonine ammonia-lyase IlvA [Cytophagales bacterium]
MQPATTGTEVLTSLSQIQEALQNISSVIQPTPLQRNHNLSEQYQCNIFLKREDLQIVRSYKIRGAFHKISSLTESQKSKGVVCASAGNHAQGVAYACNKLGISGKIYMPHTTPKQKVSQVRMFGKKFVEIVLSGDTFDDASLAAHRDSEENGLSFIHPFDDPKVIAGQGTVGMEIFRDSLSPIDYIFVPVGGGGLASGLGSFIKQVSPQTRIIGAEPAGAPAMKKSLEAGKRVQLEQIDKFVDGAAVRMVGSLSFAACQHILDDVVLIPEGEVCASILQLYNQEAIVAEPAGALSIAALDQYKDEIKEKNVVCLISGGNNDITRTEEIKERALLHQGLKHYFIITFPQRAGALRDFLVDVLGENDDIAHFEYTKKNAREKGPALVGIETKSRSDFEELIGRMNEKKINFQYLNNQSELFHFLV